MVSKEELLSRSDAISIHLVLSDRTRGLIGAADIARMKPGAILVNTSRGPIVDETALIEAVRARRIVAALDVFDREPLPAEPSAAQRAQRGDDAASRLRRAGDLGRFYPQSLENALAFLDGKPVRVTNPEALAKGGLTMRHVV